MTDAILRDDSDGVVTLTLNRPETRTALSGELIAALDDALTAVEATTRDGTTRALVLAGAGKAFCAGMDLKGVMSDPVGMREMLHGLARVTRRLRDLPIPTIARVQGAAIGGGCGLMVVPDLAITHAEAKVGYPEVSLGLCPAVVAPWLIRRIGPGRARAMLLGGWTVSGAEALEIGMASHLASRDQLEARAAELATRLAEGSPEALAVTKRWLDELEGTLAEDVLARGADLSADVLAGDEAQQRLREKFS
jgi:methylglutaconyl-CoA hydratase